MIEENEVFHISVNSIDMAVSIPVSIATVEINDETKGLCSSQLPLNVCGCALSLSRCIHVCVCPFPEQVYMCVCALSLSRCTCVCVPFP